MRLEHLFLPVFFLLIIFNISAQTDSTQLNLLWKYAAGGELASSPAVSGGGRIYLYAEDRHIHALDRDGRFLWKFRLQGRPSDSLAVSTDGSVYAGTDNGILYAVNPSGEELWSFDTGGRPAGDPSVSSDGTVYFAVGSGQLYAVSHNGRFRWKLETGERITQAPAVDSGTAVYLFGSGGLIISCTPWGSENWRYLPEGKGPAAERCTVIHDHIIYSSRGRIIEAVDSDGKLIWSMELDEAAVSIMMYKNGLCIITASGGVIGASDDGELQWQFPDAAAHGWPASAVDGIYFLSGENGIIMLSFDGEPMVQISSEGRLTQPSLTDGMLIAGSEEWIIYAYSASAPDRSIWSQRGGDSSHGGRSGENLFTFNETLYSRNLDYVYLKAMLDSFYSRDRSRALSEISERISNNEAEGGFDYLLPLLYRALGEGIIQIFRDRTSSSGTDYPEMRAEAARLTGRIGNFESVEILVKVLEYEKESIVSAAIIDALGELGTNNRNISLQAVYNKIRTAGSSGGKDRMAAAAIGAIEKIAAYSGDTDTAYGRRTLIEIYRGNYSKKIRESAIDALRRIK